MGAKGSALDNAVCESFFSTLKRELVNRYSWPTKADARVAIFEWIEVFYNRQRIHTTLGHATPETMKVSPLRRGSCIAAPTETCPLKRGRSTDSHASPLASLPSCSRH